MNNDLYDASKYTDEQLYNILDINNPTDRELEGKIIHLINKYSNMQNEAGYKLAIFFQNIYSHFFDIDETESIEGFDNPLQISNDDKTSKKEEKSITTTSTDIQATKSFDYSKDKFGINPLLKQTIKRIICIDSKYRDNKNTTMTTDFTFNLSEPLKDVVSLKLESIQIPVTWYTINKSYGSNFFYLKGNVDGINKGYHDYKFSIDSKNYTLSKTDVNTANIYDEINKAIQHCCNTYTDVNFGTTSIQAIAGSSKSQFTLDIQNIYDYSNFYLSFQNWIPCVYGPDIVGSDLINKRLLSISSYYGFNQSQYNSNTIYSNQSTLYTTTFLQSQNTKQYILDNTYNFFDIIRYNGINYDPSFNIDKYRITLSLSLSGRYSANDLYNNICSQISTSSFLDISYSAFNRIDVSNANVFNNGKTYFTLTIKLNRYTVKPILNTNLMVVFPDTPDNSNNIWKKCFNFDNSLNQLNIIKSETPLIRSNYIIDSSVNLYFKCISPREYIGINDFSLNFTSGNYLLNSLIKQLNSVISTDTYTSGSSIYINNNQITTLNLNILKSFTNPYFDISFTKPSILNKIGIYKIDINSISDSTVISGRFPNNLAGYITVTPYIFSYKQKVTATNTEYTHIYLRDLYKKNNTDIWYFDNYLKLIYEIEYCIVNSLLYDRTPYSQYPLSKTIITTNCSDQYTDGTIVDISLNLMFEFKLTEINYQVILNNGTNKIWKPLALDTSYNLIDYTNNNISTILGNNPISINIIKINDSINIFPYYDIYGGAYSESNKKQISINTNNEYSIYSLQQLINDYFNSNEILYGSKLEIIQTDLDEYIKITMNINVLYTTKDYKLVFYDPYSFVKCYIGTKSVQNTSWDSTLGWILGFRDETEYILIKSEQLNLLSSNLKFLDHI
jgi:hypothetical protein